VDYHKVNTLTATDNYPILLIENLLNCLSDQFFFSKIDLQEAYHQIHLEEKSQNFMAFKCHKGTYVYNLMPFGQKNSPSQFQRIMEIVSNEYSEEVVTVFLDDILLATKTQKANIYLFCWVMKKLIKEGFTAKKEKCEPEKEEIESLGYSIGNNKIAIDKSKLVR
jgi:23S rRNA A2030 N6-methylase RlmJ